MDQREAIGRRTTENAHLDMTPSTARPVGQQTFEGDRSARTAMALTPPQFDDEFRRKLRELFAWRRDVRRFRSDPIDPSTIEEILDVTCLAPSVGNSQPWRFVAVDDLA